MTNAADNGEAASPGQAGRPTKLTDEAREEICTRLASGESLRSICASDHLPTKSAVLLWVVNDRDGFFDQYRVAREAAGFSHADRIIDTVDKVEHGELEPSSAKTILDGLKWAAERQAPKHHSQRQELEHSGKDGGPIPVQFVAPDQYGEEEWESRQQ